MKRFKVSRHTVTRQSVGEGAIKAIQRMLVFGGYSTSSTGAFAIDGDFGRGTNRAVAQFQFDHRLTKTINRKTSCYPCNWRNAKSKIAAIPSVELTLRTMNTMLEVAKKSIQSNRLLSGDFNEALYFLNQLDRRQLLNRSIAQRY